MSSARRLRGFTLIELLAALLVLSLLALMSYRGLGAVLDARDHVGAEAQKWHRVAAFFRRFEHDVELSAPRTVRRSGATAPAWIGEVGAATGPVLEFSRFASFEGMDTARRLAYRLDTRGRIELWVWPGLDVAPGAMPARYVVLSGVKRFALQYLAPDRKWVDQWPALPGGAAIPRAVRVTVALDSGESIVRVFALTE